MTATTLAPAPSNVGAYDKIADVYDDWLRGSPDTPATVEFLAARHPGGRALELGVGTGRVAVPLAAAGLRVVGVDGNAAMTRKLAARPGAAAVEVVAGDLTAPPVTGPFDVVYAVLSTLHDLLTQDAQVTCLRAAAELLAPDGELVLESAVPDTYDSDDAASGLATSSVRRDQVTVQASTHDRTTQRVRTQLVELGADGIRLYPVQARYVWPNELDLMATLAGLRRVSRHGGWHGEPFTSSSTRHVSVYRRA